MFLGSECSWALLGYILARGMNALRRDASIREYGNGIGQGAAPARHLQPYTQSDPGALEGTSGPGLGLRRCVSSIRLSNPS